MLVALLANAVCTLAISYQQRRRDQAEFRRMSARDLIDIVDDQNCELTAVSYYPSRETSAYTVRLR